MAIVVRNSMTTCQPSLEFQASLDLWRCFVVDEKGWDEFQLMLAELRSQLPVPPVGLPSWMWFALPAAFAFGNAACAVPGSLPRLGLRD